MHITRSIGLLLPLLCYSLVSQSAELDGDDLVALFTKGSIKEQIISSKALEWSGLEDTKIFDQIEKNVLEHYQTAKGRSSVEWVIWGTKALSFSGNKKYLPTIDQVADKGNHRRIRAYAVQSHQELLKRIHWNPIINQDITGRKGSSEIKRFENMLRSDVPELNRLASKRIVFQRIQNDSLTRILLDKLEQVKSRRGSKIESDSYAWLVKALAVSGCTQHLAVIQNLASEATDKKLRKHAKKVSQTCINS